MRFIVTFIFALLAVLPCHAQTATTDDEKATFKVSLASKQNEFRIGETIPLQLAFSSEVKNRYQVNMAQYDRSGRMNYESFKLSPADGAVDPLPEITFGPGGGLTSYQFLKSEPWTIKLNLNEWVRFTRPGKYRLMVLSNRVAIVDRSTEPVTAPLSLRSNEIALTIVEADVAWQKRTLADAVAALNATQPTNPKEREKYETARRQAADTLRFLGSPDAVRELASRLGNDSDDSLDFIYEFGLRAASDREVARTSMLKALADPNHPINGTFIYTLRTLSSTVPYNDPTWREEQVKIIEQLVNVLSNKRGKAQAVSLNTALSEAWSFDDALPKQTLDALTKQLVAMFDQLPLRQQNELLMGRWNKISSPALIPLLKRYALFYRNYPEMRESNAYDSLQLSASALKRWYELDPNDARPAVIAEIVRPRPRYGARVLGLLSDKTLPEVDAALAEHLAGNDDLDGASNLASLIARYATASIMPEVMDQLDAHLGKWACAIQNPLLAYVLRIDPVVARPRIEKAIALRGEDFSACNHSVLRDVSEIHFDPVLEEIAIHSLDDPDPEIVSNTAFMLREFGSPAAQPILWRRYVDWTTKWAGREKELQFVSGEKLDDRLYEMGLGQNLVQALVYGKSWVADGPTIERLLNITNVPQIKQSLTANLTQWRDQPLTVFVSNEPATNFDAYLAQYEFHSLGDLKDKLALFPAGTKFSLSTRAADTSPNTTKSLGEVRSFLQDHKMEVAGDKRNSNQ